MTMYSHLLEHVQPILLLSSEDRIRYLYEDRWIGYERAQKIMAILEDLLKQPKRIRPLSLLLIGEPNNGKTTIIKEFVKKHYVVSERDPMTDFLEVTKPVISVDSPPTADEKALYMALLDHYFVPYRRTDSKANLRSQLLYLLRKFNTKVLVIDEIHNLLSGSMMKQREVMNAIKNLTNELSISIVGVGTKDAVQVLHTDPQHASRFDVAELPNWELDLDFRNLLLSYEYLLPLKKASNLSEKESGTLLYDISRGNLGDLNRLLVECAKEAILTGKETISLDIIMNHKSLKPTLGLRKISNF